MRRATDIYRTLDSPDEARPIRLAATQGQLNAAGEKAASMVLEMLASDDARYLTGTTVVVDGAWTHNLFPHTLRKKMYPEEF